MSSRMPAEMSKEDLIELLTRYRGFVFRWERYKQPSPEWDHDHCEGCQARFAERAEEWQDAVHTEGWVTLWPVGVTTEEEAEVVSAFRATGGTMIPSPKFNGFQLDWLCPKCFEAAGQHLGFVIDAKHPQ